MDKKITILAAIVIGLAAVIVYNLYSIVAISRTVVENNLPGEAGEAVENQITTRKKEPTAPIPAFGPPLGRAGERVAKKKFGQFITPQNSPVQPERFRGYHTGIDFEIFPEEQNVDISVKAICSGKIAQKKYASGYGGILVESCELDGQPVTIIYGHLKLASVTKKSGDALTKGEEFGILGKAFSAETNGERKHLHLGIHKGSAVDIRGYVQNQSELSGWVDPCGLQSVCK